MALEVYPIFVGPLGLVLLGLGSASPALVTLLFRKVGLLKGLLYNCGGVEFVPYYS